MELRDITIDPAPIVDAPAPTSQLPPGSSEPNTQASQKFNLVMGDPEITIPLPFLVVANYPDARITSQISEFAFQLPTFVPAELKRFLIEDFITYQDGGSLIISQSDKILRLSPPDLTLFKDPEEDIPSLSHISPDWSAILKIICAVVLYFAFISLRRPSVMSTALGGLKRFWK